MAILICGFLPVPSAIAVATASAGEPRDLWGRILFTAACVALPVLWGAVVNWLFDLWMRRPVDVDADRIFPDYQI